MWRLPVVLVLALAFSVTAAAKKPKLDYDKKIDFRSYKTYAWVEGTPAPRPGVNLCIRGAVADQLQRVGLVETDAAKADLLVTYFAVAENGMNVSTVFTPVVSTMSTPYSYTGTMWVTGYIGSSTANYFKKATLIVAIGDNKKQQMIWRSVMNDVVKQGDSKLLDQIISTIARMFKDYPPPSK